MLCKNKEWKYVFLDIKICFMVKVMKIMCIGLGKERLKEQNRDLKQED